MNIHTPERLAGESQADYRARRRHSQWLVKVARLQGPRAQAEALQQHWRHDLKRAFSVARGGI